MMYRSQQVQGPRDGQPAHHRRAAQIRGVVMFYKVDGIKVMNVDNKYINVKQMEKPSGGGFLKSK